jgi:hypothetical protein
LLCQHDPDIAQVVFLEVIIIPDLGLSGFEYRADTTFLMTGTP